MKQARGRPFQVIGTALLLLVGSPPVMAAAEAPDFDSLSLSDLQQRLAAIDAELAQLASQSLRSGVGSVGYRSKTHPDAASAEWIQIELGHEYPIDQIVLVPVIWRDTKTGFRADGFPLEFRIVAGTDEDEDGVEVASFGEEDRLLPRIAPVVTSCSGTTASWVRIEATLLSPGVWDGRFVLQLSEILVFDGEENVALRMPVRVPRGGNSDRVWSQQSLVDGFVPYLMDAHEGERSLAYVSEAGIGEEPSLTIDLGAGPPLNRVHLHRTDLSDTVPQGTRSDFGIPRRLVIEGADRADFAEAVHLVDYKVESSYDVGPNIMLRFPETVCRYVRLTATRPYLRQPGDTNAGKSQLGFAEIEVFSRGRNVALGKPVSATFKAWGSNRSLEALTDGHNLYGRILPVRDWLNQLARRHDLEAGRPFLLAELDHRYARQKANLTRMGWLAGLLAAGIAFTILVARIIRMRQVARIKERLAADLHDELGANLHTIGLLSDLAEEAKDNPEEMAALHRRIRSETERSGNAVRRCTNMLEADGHYTGLAADMQRAARRIMGKLDHDIEIEGEEHLDRLKPRTRYDLYLFYKECLVNISRHAEATEFETRLAATDEQINLTVSDNGQGLPNSSEPPIPSSLKRRARLLGAKVTAECPATDGTSIHLKLRTRRWGFRK